MNLALFLELEAAVNAVEPRVWERYNPGLSDAEIDARMAGVSFDLPDDLRALYRWKNGSDQGDSFLGPYIWMLPLVQEWVSTESSATPFMTEDWSSYIREEIRDAHYSINEPVPIELEAREFISLFDDGGDGTTIIATFPPKGSKTCEIFQNYQADFPMIGMMFRGVEPMILTAIETWQSGIFSVTEGHRGWGLEYKFKEWAEVGRRLNPDCDYWLDGAAQ